RAGDAVGSAVVVQRARTADRRRGVERRGGRVIEVAGRAGGEVQGAAVAGDVAEGRDGRLNEELAAALERDRDVDRRPAGSGALLDRAAVDDGSGPDGTLLGEGAVALNVDDAAVVQDGVVLHVERVAGGEVDRAGAVDGAGVEVGGA